jgi:hypothetical protein
VHPPGADAAGAIVLALACGQPRCDCRRAAQRGHGRTHCPVHNDPTPSLNIETKGEEVVWHCHGGCEQKAVLAALLDRKLIEPRHQQVGRNEIPTTVATYDYRDERGELLHQTVRFAPKGFRQRRPDPHGGWIWNLQGTRTVLYRLPELLAADADQQVYLVEGEKDVDRLTAAGLVATTSPMGAGKWRQEYTDFLHDRDVVVLPDNDQAGREHASTIASSLHGTARSVRIVQLPGLPEKGDISDWLDQGHSAQELEDLVEQAPEPERSPRRFRFLTASELKNRPDPEWILEDVLQRDTLALIVGAQETFKSFLALGLGMAVATGRAWHGHVASPGVVAYISAEGGSGIALRVEAWETVNGTRDGQVYFLTDQAPQLLDRRVSGDVEELLLSLADLPEKPALIVIDTLARSMVGGDENSAEDMGLLIAAAERIRQATGATVILVHHVNKQGGARGSTALLGAVHTILECSREQNSKHLLVRCGKQKDADHFAPMLFESRVVELGLNPNTDRQRSSLVLEPQIRPVLQATQGGPPLTPTSLQTLSALVDLGNEPVTFAQWRDAANLAKSTFSHARKELVDHGYAEHLPDGTYRATEAGKVQRSKGLKQGLIESQETRATEVVQSGSTTSPVREGGPLDLQPRPAGSDPTCASCNRPAGERLGELRSVGAYLLHDDCSLRPA